METSKISYLCRLSDKIHDISEKANGEKFKNGVKGLIIKSDYSQILEIDFDDYPELKPVAEKLCNYLVKSEKSKQNEIKIEIAKVL